MQHFTKPYDGTVSIPGTIALVVLAVLGILARQHRRTTDFEAGFNAGYEYAVQQRRVATRS